MPELPEVEVLVRHLAPLIQGKVIREVRVHRSRVLRPTSIRTFARKLCCARFEGLTRRGKFLLFTLRQAGTAREVQLVGHLGMTGRMYLLPKTALLPRHTAVVLDLGKERFVFEDTRYFGRLTLDASALGQLGPEPLSREFTVEHFVRVLKRTRQAIKVKLLDQSLIAGLGNIYASEALFRGGISPMIPAHRLRSDQIVQLRQSIQEVLTQAIERGSTQLLDYEGSQKQDSFFYFGRAQASGDRDPEWLRVYDRAGDPCFVCGALIQRCIQAARSTFYCPRCQAAKGRR